MTCASCVRRVELAIGKAPGVKAASVNLATETADVTFDSIADPAAVIAAISSAGYQVATEAVEIEIEGMTCASCVWRVELAIAAVPGVLKASVILPGNILRPEPQKYSKCSVPSALLVAINSPINEPSTSFG